jgi:predicted ATP-grasp superfamily ATP-dependent carboligase
VRAPACRPPARRLLVVAFSSARMIAELAAADGWQVTAVDRFADHDLRAVGEAIAAGSGAAIAALATRIPSDAVVYGGGLENRPDLVTELARGRELLGVGARSLAAVRDPWTLGEAVRAAGAAMPETRAFDDIPARPRDGRGRWLRKPRSGGAGRGVRGWAGGRLRASEILQRRIDGIPCSAVAIGDGRRAAFLGLTEQLLRPGCCAWIGNVTPPRLPAAEAAELAGRMREVCDEISGRFGVRGAFGVDAVWDGRRPWVLEVNPRPTAALELFTGGTFAAHVRGIRGLASAGCEPDGNNAAPMGTPLRMKLVLFADHDLRAPAPDWWPAGLVRDIPCRGQAIRAGEPVCTLVADCDDVPALARRGAALLRALPGKALARG